jgi:PPOX class probable F420-dependent enzyme
MATGDDFDRNRYLSLATFRKNGAEVATPVWFAAHGGKLYVFSADSSGKVKRLRNSDRAKIAACDARGRVSGPWRETKARIVGDRALEQDAYAALNRKYGVQKRVLDFFSFLSGKIGSRALIEID